MGTAPFFEKVGPLKNWSWWNALMEGITTATVVNDMRSSEYGHDIGSTGGSGSESGSRSSPSVDRDPDFDCGFDFDCQTPYTTPTGSDLFFKSARMWRNSTQNVFASDPLLGRSQFWVWC
jgi:hypothetical protein